MKKKRVLVVDDDPMILDVILNFLDFMGYEADACNDGHESIMRYVESRASDNPYNIVILDLNMGHDDKGGVDILQALRLHDEHVTAVCCSGKVFMENIIEEHGFVGHIKKPFVIPEMISVMEHAASKCS